MPRQDGRRREAGKWWRRVAWGTQGRATDHSPRTRRALEGQLGRGWVGPEPEPLEPEPCGGRHTFFFLSPRLIPWHDGSMDFHRLPSVFCGPVPHRPIDPLNLFPRYSSVFGCVDGSRSRVPARAPLPSRAHPIPSTPGHVLPGDIPPPPPPPRDGGGGTGWGLGAGRGSGHACRSSAR